MLRGLVFLVASTMMTTGAFAKTMRASQLGESALQSFMSGDHDDVLEFQSGDKIKVTFKADGDLLESTSNGFTKLKVKTTFYIRKDNDQLLMSFDGQDFKPLKEVITGRLSANASRDSAATDINIVLFANIKQ